MYIPYKIRDEDCLIRVDRVSFQKPDPYADNDWDCFGWQECDYTVCNLDKTPNLDLALSLTAVEESEIENTIWSTYETV